MAVWEFLEDWSRTCCLATLAAGQQPVPHTWKEELLHDSPSREGIILDLESRATVRRQRDTVAGSPGGNRHVKRTHLGAELGPTLGRLLSVFIGDQFLGES